MIAQLSLALSICLAVLTLGDFYLLFMHRRRSDAAITREKLSTENLEVLQGHEPKVCVQLPVYNEPNVVADAIASLCSLAWPRDRLEILVLDDSTDETISITRREVDEWVARGHDIKIVHRPVRAEFKAGALQLGLETTDASYIAVFDVDY